MVFVWKFFRLRNLRRHCKNQRSGIYLHSWIQKSFERIVLKIYHIGYMFRFHQFRHTNEWS